MIHIAPETPRSTPAIEGLVVTDGVWKLDIARYESFVETTTGISVDDSLSGADCYRIGNRLEALVTEHQQTGEWTPALVETYPDVGSLGEIVGLARFFRECHKCCLADGTAGPSG